MLVNNPAIGCAFWHNITPRQKYCHQQDESKPKGFTHDHLLVNAGDHAHEQI